MNSAAAPAPLRLGLVGSPNSGKTTLFNALTGLRAKVGNYPGVTVERREGAATFEGRRSVVIDLPGSYSLSPVSPDEEVVVRVLDGKLNGVPHALAVVADTYLFSKARPLRFVHYGDNLIPKVLYWPLLLGVMVAVTLSPL